MKIGFPVRLIDTVRCTRDGGTLVLQEGGQRLDSIVEGNLYCKKCGTTFEVRDGILDLLVSEKDLNHRSHLEMKVRDVEAVSTQELDEETSYDFEIEVPSTIRRLGQLKGKVILELGAGTGKYTARLARECERILAVDLSWKSLLIAAERFKSSRNIGLVRADVSSLWLSPDSFDLGLSTLYSNLPTYEMRRASVRLISISIKRAGKYVLSAHHYDVRMALRRKLERGTYDNGIFYQCFTRKSLESEISDYFEKARYETIAIWMPYLSRLKWLRIPLSRFLENIPVFNKLGALLLAVGYKQ